MVKGLDLGLRDIGLPQGRGKILYQKQISTRYEPKISISTNININRLARSIDNGFIDGLKRITDDLRRGLAEAILADIWQTTDGTGDIYLSGELLRSQEVSISGGSIQISYDAPYASLLYYGGYIVPYGNQNTNKVYIPPRPWIISVINGLNGIPEIDYGGIIYSALVKNGFG